MKRLLHDLERANLPFDVGGLCFCAASDIGTRLARGEAEGEELLDLVQREAQRLSVLDEAQSLDRLVGNGALSYFRARRFSAGAPAAGNSDSVDLDPGALAAVPTVIVPFPAFMLPAYTLDPGPGSMVNFDFDMLPNGILPSLRSFDTRIRDNAGFCHAP